MIIHLHTEENNSVNQYFHIHKINNKKEKPNYSLYTKENDCLMTLNLHYISQCFSTVAIWKCAAFKSENFPASMCWQWNSGSWIPQIFKLQKLRNNDIELHTNTKYYSPNSYVNQMKHRKTKNVLLNLYPIVQGEICSISSSPIIFPQQ